MSAFNAFLGYIKSHHIALLEKYLGRELQQPNLVNFSELKRILLIKHHDSVSDFLLAAPAFSALKQAFPSIHLGVLVHPRLQSLASVNPNIDEVVIAPPEPEISFRQFMKVTWMLRKKWDMVIVLNTAMHSLAGDLIARFSGAKLILGSAGRIFPGTRRNFMYNLIAPLWPDHIHQSDKNLDILRFIGIDNEPANSGLTLPKKRLTIAFNELESKGYRHDRPLIGIHIGGGKLFGTWPLGRLADFTRLLKKKYDAQIALFWGKEDVEKSEQFMNYLQFKIFKIAPQSNLNTACFMKLCDAFIVNDNWAMHLSAAVGTPLVAIFGPTNPMEYKPWGEQFSAVRGKREKADNITVEQVEASLLALLGEKLSTGDAKVSESASILPVDERNAQPSIPEASKQLNNNQHAPSHPPKQKSPSLTEKLDISEDVLVDFEQELNRLNWQVKTAEERIR